MNSRDTAETAAADPIPVFAMLRSPRSMVFGVGQRHALAPIVAALGTSVLVCTDQRLASSPFFAQAIGSLRGLGLAVSIFDGVEVELPSSGLSACVDRARQERPDVIVGIGGGSCLDHAKITSTLLTHGGDPSDYFGENLVPGPVLPVVAVPTTAGTGSEATPVAVVTDERTGIKVGISSPYLIPHTAIVDPELSVSAPPTLTAHAGADALAHCVESYTAVRRTASSQLAVERVFVGASLLTDHYALAGIQLIAGSLERAVSDGSDLAARSDMALAALYGGLALATAGTAAAHALQYPVGAKTRTSHGVGVGLLLPYVMEFNMPERVPELGRVARALGAGGGAAPLAGEALARAGIEAVAGLLAAVGIPTTLRDLGLAADQLDETAQLSMKSTRLVDNNPRTLDADAARRILQAAYDGDRTGLGSAVEVAAAPH